MFVVCISFVSKISLFWSSLPSNGGEKWKEQTLSRATRILFHFMNIANIKTWRYSSMCSKCRSDQLGSQVKYRNKTQKWIHKIITNINKGQHKNGYIELIKIRSVYSTMIDFIEIYVVGRKKINSN